jgi:hypothetical protein
MLVGAAHQGFLSGLNTIVLIGALVAFAGAAVAAWLVREHEIEREQLELVSGPTVAAPAGR